jgi:hypothetical protein
MSSSLITNSDYLINLNSGANTLSIAGTVAITGNLSVSGNATLSGNILGDRIQNGTTSIDIQTINGNANITIGGTSNVAVFATTGAYVAGLVSATGNITSAANVNANNASVTTAVYVPIVSTLSGNLNLISAPSTNIVIDAGSGTGNINLPAKTANTILFVNADKNMKSSANLQYNGTSVIVNGEISATGNITGDNFSAVNLVINSITSDDSSFVTIDDGVNVNGEILATGNITGGNISTAGVVKTGVFVTGTIPTAAGVGAGARAFVTDADSVTFGNLYTGGSGNAMPVWSNGTSWYVG